MSEQEIQLVEIKPINYQATSKNPERGTNCIQAFGYNKESALASLMDQIKRKTISFRVQSPCGFWMDEWEFRRLPNNIPSGCGLGESRGIFFAIPIDSVVTWSSRQPNGNGGTKIYTVESRVRPLSKCIVSNIKTTLDPGDENYHWYYDFVTESIVRFPAGSYFWKKMKWHPTKNEYDSNLWKEEFGR